MRPILSTRFELPHWQLELYIVGSSGGTHLRDLPRLVLVLESSLSSLGPECPAGQENRLTDRMTRARDSDTNHMQKRLGMHGMPVPEADLRLNQRLVL